MAAPEEVKKKGFVAPGKVLGSVQETTDFVAPGTVLGQPQAGETPSGGYQYQWSDAVSSGMQPTVSPRPTGVAQPTQVSETEQVEFEKNTTDAKETIKYNEKFFFDNPENREVYKQNLMSKYGEGAVNVAVEKQEREKLTELGNNYLKDVAKPAAIKEIENEEYVAGLGLADFNPDKEEDESKLPEALKVEEVMYDNIVESATSNMSPKQLKLYKLNEDLWELKTKRHKTAKDILEINEITKKAQDITESKTPFLYDPETLSIVTQGEPAPLAVEYDQQIEIEKESVLASAKESATMRKPFVAMLSDIFVDRWAAFKSVEEMFNQPSDIENPMGGYFTYKQLSTGQANMLLGVDDPFSYMSGDYTDRIKYADRLKELYLKTKLESDAATRAFLLNENPAATKKSMFDLFGQAFVKSLPALPDFYPSGIVEDSDIDYIREYQKMAAGEELPVTPEQAEKFENSFVEDVAEGIGGMGGFLVKLLALKSVVGAASKLTGIKNLMTGLRASPNKMDKVIAWFMGAGMEEGTMQLAGLKPGVGTGFFAGQSLVDKANIKLKGRLGRIFQGAIDLAIKGTSGTTGMELGEISASAYQAVANDKDFKEELEKHFGSNRSDVFRKILVDMTIMTLFSGLIKSAAGVKKSFDTKLITDKIDRLEKTNPEEADILRKAFNERNREKTEKEKEQIKNAFFKEYQEGKDVVKETAEKVDKAIWETGKTEKEVDDTEKPETETVGGVQLVDDMGNPTMIGQKWKVKVHQFTSKDKNRYGNVKVYDNDGKLVWEQDLPKKEFEYYKDQINKKQRGTFEAEQPISFPSEFGMEVTGKPKAEGGTNTIVSAIEKIKEVSEKVKEVPGKVGDALLPGESIKLEKGKAEIGQPDIFDVKEEADQPTPDVSEAEVKTVPLSKPHVGVDSSLLNVKYTYEKDKKLEEVDLTEEQKAKWKKQGVAPIKQKNIPKKVYRGTSTDLETAKSEHKTIKKWVESHFTTKDKSIVKMMYDSIMDIFDTKGTLLNPQAWHGTTLFTSRKVAQASGYGDRLIEYSVRKKPLVIVSVEDISKILMAKGRMKQSEYEGLSTSSYFPMNVGRILKFYDKSLKEYGVDGIIRDTEIAWVTPESSLQVEKIFVNKQQKGLIIEYVNKYVKDGSVTEQQAKQFISKIEDIAEESTPTEKKAEPEKPVEEVVDERLTEEVEVNESRLEELYKESQNIQKKLDSLGELTLWPSKKNKEIRALEKERHKNWREARRERLFEDLGIKSTTKAQRDLMDDYIDIDYKARDTPWDKAREKIWDDYVNKILDIEKLKESAKKEVEVKADVTDVEPKAKTPTLPKTPKTEVEKAKRKVEKETQDLKDSVKDAEQLEEIKKIEQEESNNIGNKIADIVKKVEKDPKYTPEDLREDLEKEIEFILDIHKIEDIKKVPVKNRYIKDIPLEKIQEVQNELQNDTPKSLLDLYNLANKLKTAVDNAHSQVIKKKLIAQIKKASKLKPSEKGVKSGSPGYGDTIIERIERYSDDVKSKKYIDEKLEYTAADPESLYYKRLEKTQKYRDELEDLLSKGKLTEKKEKQLEDINEKYATEFEKLDAHNLHNLTNKELKDILEDINNLKTQGKTRRRLWNRENRRFIQEQSDILLDELDFAGETYRVTQNKVRPTDKNYGTLTVRDRDNDVVLIERISKEDFESVKQESDEKNRLKSDTYDKRDQDYNLKKVAYDILGTASTLTGGVFLPKTKMTEGLRKRMKERTLNYDYFLNHLNKWNLFDILFETSKAAPYSNKWLTDFAGRLNRAKETKLKGLEDSYNKIRDGIIEWDIPQDFSKKTIKVKGSKEILSRDKAIAIYMASKNPGKLAAMLAKGENKDGMQNMEYTQEYIDNVISELKETDIKFADHILKFYQESWPSLSQAFYDMEGFYPPKLEGYSPMVKKAEGLKDGGPPNLLDRMTYEGKAATNANRTKERVGSVAPFRLSFTKDLLEYISSTEHYKALQPFINDYTRILSKSKGGIQETYGTDYYNILDKWFNDVAGDGRIKLDDAEHFFRTLRKGVTTGTLGLNLVTMMKQSISGISVMNELGMKNTLSGISEYWGRGRVDSAVSGKTSGVFTSKSDVGNRKKIDQFIADYAPIINARGKSFERDIKDAMESEELGPKVGVSKGLLPGLTDASTVAQASMGPIRWMDGLTVRSAFWAAYKSKGGTLEKVNQEALDYANGVIERTQPRGDVSELSGIQRGGELSKLMTMYMNQPNQYFNMLYAAQRNYLNTRVGYRDKGGPLAAMATAWLLPSIAFTMFDKGFTQDADDIKNNVMYQPVKNLFFLGYAAEAAKEAGFSYKITPIQSQIEQAISGFKDMTQREMYLSGVVAMVKAALIYKGYPAVQVERTLKSLYDWDDPDSSSKVKKDLRYFIYSEYALENLEDKKEKQGFEEGIKKFGGDKKNIDSQMITTPIQK